MLTAGIWGMRAFATCLVDFVLILASFFLLMDYVSRSSLLRPDGSFRPASDAIRPREDASGKRRDEENED